jgi:hypothetical protein
MILLRPDCLVFEHTNGENVPLSAETVSIELVGDTHAVDTEAVKHAAAAVLHYFKYGLGKQSVSMVEFSAALERALEATGIQVAVPTPVPFRCAEADLRSLAGEAGEAAELFFFPRLRHELRRKLSVTPTLVRFHGLRPCVKRLLGARRWTTRCQELNDRIVEFLRSCFTAEQADTGCALLVI